MNKLILHIPHSSKYIPADAVYMVDQNTVDKEILKLTDWYTDDLFSSNDVINVKAEFSRVFCDPERFSEDSQEVMAQYGMGVLYEKSDEGFLTEDIHSRLINLVDTNHKTRSKTRKYKRMPNIKTRKK